jgi:hypothetical protein
LIVVFCRSCHTLFIFVTIQSHIFQANVQAARVLFIVKSVRIRLYNALQNGSKLLFSNISLIIDIFYVILKTFEMSFRPFIQLVQHSLHFITLDCFEHIWVVYMFKRTQPGALADKESENSSIVISFDDIELVIQLILLQRFIMINGIKPL